MIPAWEQEAKRPFLVHGESILHILMETVSATDQENRRKPARAGSVPPRSTTPVNSLHAYAPSAKTGVVTPAVRPGTASQSVPNKRQRLAETAPSGHQRQGSGNGHTTNYGRAPLGSYRGGNVGPSRRLSPSNIPGKTPNEGQSSLPQPATLGRMPIPKPGTQHHALGHGRVPSTAGYPGGPVGSKSVSSAAGLTSSTYGGRYGSGNAATGTMKKATRARRESFKPRPSIDDREMGLSVHGGRWGGLTGSVREEEDEEY